uniref:Ubiquitin-like protease family profile domain-containing protein n=1 Tax=Triticum urartu TaxID=4572 RepID=A0A8R7UTQ4_TRIUA
MDLVINYWKGSPECNHVYKSGDRVLLSPYVINYLLEIDPYHRPVDEDGQEVPGPPFNVKLAAQKFKLYIKENLLAANLIMLPYWNLNHFTLYTMNKYRESLDIHDSWRYTGRNLSRNRFHGERVEIMSMMSLLMKEVYGEAGYNSSRQPRWEHLADRCSYAKMPEQGVNECGFYMLKAAYLYDGTKLVEEVKKRDPHSAYWKAECLFYVLFHPSNEVRRDQWPREMADIAKLLQA